jgi:hypothetical protein
MIHYRNQNRRAQRLRTILRQGKARRTHTVKMEETGIYGVTLRWEDLRIRGVHLECHQLHTAPQ